MKTQLEKKMNRVLAAADIVEKGKIAVIEKLYETMEFIDEHKEFIEGMVKEHVSKIPVIHGKDGKDYVITEKDKSDILKSIKVPVVKQVVEKQTIVKEVPIVKETIIKEPLTLKFTPQEIRDLLELLQEDERIDPKAIKNLEEFVKNIAKLNPPNGPMLHPVALSNLPDVSVVGVTTNQTLVWNGTYWTNQSNNQPTLTSGTVNGVNTVFVFSTAPNVIVVDQGKVMQKVSSDGTVNWTGTTTVTLTVAPNFDLIALS